MLVDFSASFWKEMPSSLKWLHKKPADDGAIIFLLCQNVREKLLQKEVVLVAQGFIESCCSRTLWMYLALGDVAGDNRSGFCYLSEVL